MGSRKKPKTESLCLLLLLNPHPAVVYNSAFLTVTDIFIFAKSRLPLAQCCHKLSTLYLCKSWPPRRELHVILNLPTVRSLWLSLTDDTAPVSPVGVLVLLRLPVGVELAVLGHHAVPLAVGVDHAEYPRPPGERVPSATLSLPLLEIYFVVSIRAWKRSIHPKVLNHGEQTARKIFGRWADFEMFVMMFSFYSTVKRYRHIK